MLYKHLSSLIFCRMTEGVKGFQSWPCTDSKVDLIHDILVPICKIFQHEILYFP